MSEIVNLRNTAEPTAVAVGDRIQFAIDIGGGQALAGEGFVSFVEPREPHPWAFVCVLGAPQLVVIPCPACRVLERGALIRRVLTS
jgi:hypothetical protein